MTTAKARWCADQLLQSCRAVPITSSNPPLRRYCAAYPSCDPPKWVLPQEILLAPTMGVPHVSAISYLASQHSPKGLIVYQCQQDGLLCLSRMRRCVAHVCHTLACVSARARVPQLYTAVAVGCVPVCDACKGGSPLSCRSIGAAVICRSRADTAPRGYSIQLLGRRADP